MGGRGACMVGVAGGHVWWGACMGGMHGREVCVAGGMCMAGGKCMVWTCMEGGCVWQGACVANTMRYRQ